MDFDPDGIAIMSNYKYGSWNLSHESTNLAIPDIRWLGLRSCELLCNDDGEATQGLLPLSVRDRKKAMKMLEKLRVSEDGVEQQWRRELQVMLMLGFKAEMEILADVKCGVSGWIERRLLEETGKADIRDIQ